MLGLMAVVVIYIAAVCGALLWLSEAVLGMVAGVRDGGCGGDLV